MRVSVKKVCQGESILSGVAVGRACLAALLADVPEPEQAQPYFLDFTGISVATASFLREGPLQFRRIVRDRDTNIFPVIANAEPDVIDELKLFLSHQNDAVLACVYGEDLVCSSVTLVGTLDQKQLLAFKLLVQLGEADALTLSQSSTQSEVVGLTAWNNRLAGLAERGLAVATTRGRSKVFSLPVEVGQSISSTDMETADGR